MPEIELLLEDTQERMDKTLGVMKHDFQAIRTGKASPALVEGLSVEYYGATVRLKDIASITAPEPRLLVIQPWDQNAVKEIEKAILASDIGISPVSDGRVIRLPIPELSEERRKDMVRLVHKRAEEGRVEVRAVRRDANEVAKKAQKDGLFTEDELKKMLDEIQKLTDQYIANLDKELANKEKELMTV